MKKILQILTLALVLSLVVSTAVFAKEGVGNPKGEVKGWTDSETDGYSVTIITEDGELFVINVSEDFDFSFLEFGMVVVAKGEWTDEGFFAEWVKEADEEEETEEPVVEETEELEVEETEEPEDGEGEEDGEGGAWCNGHKEGETHPVAEKIVEKYEDLGYDAEWVMEQKCGGFGFGNVMLALQTEKLEKENGEEGNGRTADDLLEEKKGGKGWGQIWKDTGLVETEDADSPPPGKLKKPDKQNGPPEDKGPNKEKPNKPEKPDNGKGPKNKESESGGEEDAEGQ